MRSLTLFFACILGFEVVQGQVDFKNPVELASTFKTTSRFGDIDGDGDNDVVFTTYYKSAVFVLYNDNSEFTRLETVVEPMPGSSVNGDLIRGPLAFDLYDMNDDDVKDIIVTSHTGGFTNKISIYSYTVDRFQKINDINVTEPDILPSRLHIADINKDDKPDILIPYRGNIYEFESQPDGSYLEKKIPAPGIAAQSSTLTDIDDDDNQDLVLTKNSSMLSIYKSDNTGNIALDRELEGPGDWLANIVVADYNGDDKKDIIGFASANGNVIIYFFVQQPDGSFTTQTINTSTTPNINVSSVDIDNDGDMDFVYDSSVGDGFAFMINNGTGSFIEEFISFNSNLVMGLDFADVDGDNLPEMVISDDGGHIEILKKTVDNLETYTNFQFSPTPGGNGLLADLNNDGRNDLVTLNNHSKAIIIRYNTGNNDLFGEPVYFVTNLRPEKMVVGDFNGDTFKDVLYLTAEFKGEVDSGILWGSANGDLTHEILDPGTYPPATTPFELNTGDFNNDGYDDWVSTADVNFGKPDGTFEHVTIPAYDYLIQAVADFNNDGFDDIILLANDYRLTIHWGKDDYSFDEDANTFGTDIQSLKVANLNGDDFPDLIYTNSAKQILLLINNDNGDFTEVDSGIISTDMSGFPAKTHFLSDIDQDGDDDLLMKVNSEPSPISVYLNDGSGVFTLDSQYGQFDPGMVIAGLVDDNSFPDVMLITFGLGPIVMIDDFTSEPSLLASNITISDRTSSSATISFQPGNGNGRIMLLREGTSTDAVPQDNYLYLAHPNIGDGAMLGSSYVVLSGNETSVTVTNLKAGTTYHYSIFESNQNEKQTFINYFTSGSASGSFTTKAIPTITFKVTPKTFGDGQFALDATSTSGATITYEVIIGDVTVIGNMVTINGPGPVTMIATAAPNEDFDGTSTEATFCVNPAKPTITLSYNSSMQPVLTCSSESNNTWYLDGNGIEGGNEQVILPTAEGKYVVVTEYNSCVSASNPFDYVILGVEESSKVSVSPNPATTKLFIKMDATGSQSITPTVIDMKGRIFAPSFTRSSDGIELNVQDLSAGLYILRVGHNVAYKFLKQ